MSHKQQRQMHATLSETEQSRLRSWVLYADQHIIAINKPPKLPVQGGPGVHRALTDWLHYLRDLPNITTEHVQLVDSLNVPSASQSPSSSSPTPYSTRTFSTQAKFKAFQPGTIPQGPKRSASARLLDSLTEEEKLLFTDKVIKRKKESRAFPLVDVSTPTEPKPTVSIEIPPPRKLQRFATNQTPSPVSQSAKPSNPESRSTQTSHIELDNDDSALETPRLVHRLDAETSGVLLLARSRQAAHKFTDMFRTHDYEKTYWAVCEGRPQPAAGIIDQPLSILSDDKPASTDSHDHVTQTAITKYSTVASNQECSWLELKPKTGRKHQLRRHVLLLDCCIVGDKKHAADESLSSDALSRRQRVKGVLDVSEPTLHLHARAIRFKHPFTNTIMEINANLPTHMLRSMHKLKFNVGSMDEKSEVERSSKIAL
jgi:23S rRNA-/tRNA-specific pseudouridylate synthase